MSTEEILTILRQRADSRRRQAEALEKQKNLQQLTVTMPDVVRLKLGEIEACIDAIERWFK